MLDHRFYYLLYIYTMDINTQEKLFIRFRNKYSSLVPKKNINRIGIIEGMEEMRIEDVDSMEKAKLKKIKDRFNMNLTKYSSKMQLYLNELMGRAKGGGTYANKVISHNNINYFVTKNSQVRKFSDASWADKGKACTQPQHDLNADSFQKLQSNGIGPEMNANERCKSGPYNVTDGSNYAWVDATGYKYIYDDPSVKHSSCPNNFVKGFTSTEFNAIPDSGSSQSRTSECKTGALDSPLAEQVESLNIKLMDDAKKIKELINSSTLNDKDIETNVDAQRIKLMNTSKKVQEARKKVQEAESKSATLRSDLEDRVLEINSMNIQRWVWIMAGITFALVASKKINDASNS